MPRPANLLKAVLQEVSLDTPEVQEVGEPIPVQFNPETLKVSFSNQKSGGDQRGGSAIQFVGQGATKLGFDLWFDVTAPAPDQPEEDDVRRLTKKVVELIQPKESGQQDKYVPPGVRFLWGTFLFEGVIDSINENLEFFSEQGKPLRASVSLAMSRQEIQFQFGNQQAPGLGSAGAPGTRPQRQARAGDTVQDMAAQEDRQDQWQEIAAANDIDNPRQLPPGTPIDTRV